MTGESAEELSSGAGDGPRSPSRRRLVVSCLALTLVVATGILLRVETTHRRHLALLRREDKVNVGLSFGASESTTDAAGRLVSANVEVELDNHGGYPIYIRRPDVQLAGVTVSGWVADEGRIAPDATTTLRVRYEIACPRGTAAILPGELTVEVLSVAGRLHRLTLPLRATDGISDPVTQQMRDACGALLFGDALTLETLRTTTTSATVVLHNHGRTRMEVRTLGVVHAGFSVRTRPTLPVAIPARGQRRVTIGFGVSRCGRPTPSDDLSLFVRGSNEEPGGAPGDAGYSDDAITRMLTTLIARTCHR